MIPEWGRGKQFQVVDADDLARAFATCVGNPAAFNKSYASRRRSFSPLKHGFSSRRGVGIQFTVRAHSRGHTGKGRPRRIRLPIAGYPFGQFMMDTLAIRSDLGFELTDGANWIKAMVIGCAQSPPVGDSDGYERRATEIALAERAIGFYAEESSGCANQ